MEPNTNNQTWVSRLKEQLFGKKTEPQNTTQTEVKPPVQDADAGKRTAKTVPDIPSPFDNLGLSEGDGNLVPATLKEHFNILYKQFKDLGEQKGRLGHDDIPTIDALAQSEASIFHERVKAEVGGKVDALVINRDCHKTHLDKMQSDYEQQKNYYNAFQNERITNPNSFSWLLLGFYLTVGVTLLFADCVLALNLMSIAFNFSTSQDTAVNLTSLGTADTWPIIKHNWQVLITSLGIALLSIYIKIFYDEYIGPADGNSQIRAKWIVDNIAEDTASKSKVKTWLYIEMGLKFLIRCIILGTTLYLLYLLAQLRFYAEVSLDPQGVFALHKETRTTVFLLTLLFPVVAGICFSLGIKVWQNRKSFKRSKNELNLAKTLLDNAITKYQLSEKQLTNAQKTFMDWITPDSFLADTKRYLIASYKNGYWIDYVNPDHNDIITDIVERMADFRNKNTARRHYSLLYKP